MRNKKPTYCPDKIQTHTFVRGGGNKFRLNNLNVEILIHEALKLQFYFERKFFKNSYNRLVDTCSYYRRTFMRNNNNKKRNITLIMNTGQEM